MQDLRQLIENTIDNNDYYGRSFTYGVAFYTLAKNGAFSGDDTIAQTVDDMLIDATANYLGLDYQTISEKISTGAMIETLDISVLDDIARVLIGENGGV